MKKFIYRIFKKQNHVEVFQSTINVVSTSRVISDMKIYKNFPTEDYNVMYDGWKPLSLEELAILLSVTATNKPSILNTASLN